MRSFDRWVSCVLAGALLGCATHLDVAEQKKEGGAAWQVQYVDKSDPWDGARFEAIGKALGVEKLPQSERAHMAPLVSKEVLEHPERVSRESTSYGIVAFAHEPWGYSTWDAEQVVENTNIPDALPAHNREMALLMMEPSAREDPEKVEEVLWKSYERYVFTQRYKTEGELRVEMYLGPNSRAVQEQLVVKVGDGNMGTESLVDMWGGAKRDLEIGDASYLYLNPMSKYVWMAFIRDNVVVRITGRGSFERDVASLAKAIDEAIQSQPVMTQAELEARRPVIEMGTESRKEEGEGGRGSVACTVTTSPDTEIAELVPTVDGRYQGIVEGRILLPSAKSGAAVKVVVVTKGLLANTVVSNVEPAK